MSFFRISDPKKRDALVAEYLSSVKRLQKQDIIKRTGDLYQDQDMERQYKPITQSNKQMIKAINANLLPIEEGIKDLNELVKIKSEEDQSSIFSPPHKKRRTTDPYVENVLKRIKSRDSDIDTTFGIYFGEDGRPYIGSKRITIQNGDIIVDHIVYNETRGLWRLIAEGFKAGVGEYNRDYTEEDLSQYMQLLRQTNALHHNFDPNNPHPRSSNSWKWKKILNPIWKKLKNEDTESDNSSEEDKFDDDEEEEGDGLKIVGGRSIVQYLPGSIKELRKKLKILLAEFIAGNTTTRNELVAVLDQLRARSVLSEKEYKTINTLLSQ